MHDGTKILYECYPHLNAQGGTWIKGTIETIEGVQGIRTAPEEMVKGSSLEGFSDFIPDAHNTVDLQILNCPCHRCNPKTLILKHDYCYVIAYEIDEDGNYTDAEGNFRNGQTHLLQEVNA